MQVVGRNMDELRKRYACLVLETMVRVQQGDALSINTESHTLPFAKLLAGMASEITQQPVHIVVTEHGKPQGVIPVEPVEHDILQPTPTGAAMIRIVDTEHRNWSEPDDLAAASADFVALQEYEHLADPLIFDRRIAVPWAVVHVPGPNWAKYLIGDETREDALWDMLQDIWKLDHEQFSTVWESQSQLLHYRKRQLEQIDAKQLRFVSAGTDLTVDLAQHSHWEGGLQVLPNGRTFIPSLPLEELFIAVDRSSASGRMTASRPIGLFGEQVLVAEFELCGGKVVAWDAEHGKKLLDAFFDIDEGAKHIGEVALADENTAVSRSAELYGVSLLDRNRTTRVRFGSASLSCLDPDLAIEDETGLHESTTFNLSNVVCDCPIGDGELEVFARTHDGRTIQLMEHGVFLD